MEVCIQCPYCLKMTFVFATVSLAGLLVDADCCYCGSHIIGHIDLDKHQYI
jgi:hypothetical protein